MMPSSFLGTSLLVALGGGAGAWLRFSATRLWSGALGEARAAHFPYATLSVNVVGSLAMGLLTGWLTRHGSCTPAQEQWRLLLGVGVLGGFTTFSAFSLETVLLAQRGAYMLALIYVALSLLAGFAALLGGMALVRGLA